MENMKCSPCFNFDGNEVFREIGIFGKKVRVKDYICSPDGVTYRKKGDEVRLQMSVCLGSYCPCACPFCIAKDTKQHRRIDIGRFAQILTQLNGEKLVRGIKITGGEPFCNVDALSELISAIFEICGDSFEVSVSTNGMYLEKMHRIKDLAKLESVHVSRHHYNDEINRSLFGGGAVPSGEALREIMHTVSYRDLFVLNCMLLKNYIGSPEEAHRYMDFAVGTGAQKVGFIEAYPANAFCREQFVPFDRVLTDGDPQLLFTRGFSDRCYCRCRDGVYVSPAGELTEFYGRSTAPYTQAYCRGLGYADDGRLYDRFGVRMIL